jgi:hypothetical protein
MAKVYVSSTIADLKQERQAVLEWLLRARHQAVDSYLPNSETVRESFLDDVGACDLYVLILGHRYGFQQPDNNPEGLSITQQEFRRAGQSGKPQIALVRTSIPDVSLSDLADPQRLALVSAFRAEVGREVRAAEFGDLQELIQGLSTGVQAELEKLGKRPDGPRTAGPVLRLAPRLPFLAGREELLAELDDKLAGGEHRWPQVVAVTGLGGAGKTSVAVEYAHRHLDQVGVAWQLPAKDAAVLAAGFTELAAQLSTGGAVENRDPVAAVHSALASYPGGWLLIFDNAPAPGLAREFLPPAGKGQVRVSGPEHPDTLTDRANLASYTGEVGDAASARDQYATLLPIREKVSGPEHPDTLIARANLAAWTGQAGDAAGARDQFAALLPIEERVLGPEHPSTLSNRGNLARWTGQAGDAAGARNQFAALLPLMEGSLALSIRPL